MRLRLRLLLLPFLLSLSLILAAAVQKVSNHFSNMIRSISITDIHLHFLQFIYNVCDALAIHNHCEGVIDDIGCIF